MLCHLKMEFELSSLEFPSVLSEKATDQICEHVLGILQKDGLRTENRLGALVILNKMFDCKFGDQVKTRCLKSELISFLMSALDTGFMFCHKPLEVMLASVAMETIFHLSKMQVCLIQSLTADGVIKRLLGYLDTTEKFYKFPDSLKSTLVELCEGKQLVGKVKVISMSTDPLEYIHKHTDQSIKRLPHLTERVKVCQLFDTSSDTDLNIAEHLVSEGLALTGEFPGHVIAKERSNAWQEIIVTKVLAGGIFWALVGEQDIKGLFEIQDQLNGELSLQPAHNLLPGNLVVVRGDILGRSYFVRAQILSVEGGRVHVFAIDYGYEIVSSDQQVFKVPRELDVGKCPPKSSLCSIADVHPAPIDHDTVQNAAAILSNLCKQNNWTATVIREHEGVKIILRLLKCCQRSRLATHILTLVCNLACSANVRNELAESGAVEVVLDVLRIQLSKKSTSGDLLGEVNLVLAHALLCLSSLMHNCMEARSHFYEHQGIDVTLQLIKSVGVRHHLYQMSVKVLRSFIGSALIKESPAFRSAVHAHSSVPKDRRQEQYDPTSHGNLGDGRRKEADEDQRIPLATNSSKGLHPGATDHAVSTLKKKLSRLQLGRKPQAPMNYSSESDDEHQEPCSSLTSMGVTGRGQQPYMQGQLVRFADDDTHELLSHKHIATISELMIAQHLCAMLNSGHGGTVYFGIEKSRLVFGLEMSRDEKDRVRLGVDQLMFGKISPGLLHSQFEFRAVPVHDVDTSLPILDTFVIEVTVRANKGTIYTMTDGACYYRFGSDTERISSLDLRKLVCLEEEYTYSEQILRLQMQKAQLLQEVADQKSISSN